jgi:hypothetical protein
MSDSWNPKDATLATSALIRRTENPLRFTSGISYPLSCLYIQFYNLRLLFYPVQLCAEYSYNCIPMIEVPFFSFSSFPSPRPRLLIPLLAPHFPSLSSLPASPLLQF